jgi:hypothetical protein
VTVEVDVARLFPGIPPQKPGGASTHSASGDTLATNIKSNIEVAFTIAQIGS